MNILAFAASSNTRSINEKLASYVAHLIEGGSVEVLNIDDYEMPLFSEDRERQLGQPYQARAFFQKIGAADAIIVSFAEHNGSYTAAYKNLFDWTSRIDTRVFQSKPMIYLSASPGPGGAANVLAAAVESAPHFGADIRASLSVPRFHDNFDLEANMMINADIQAQLWQAVQRLQLPG
jgi:chromate reductase